MENANSNKAAGTRIKIANGANFLKVLARIKQYCGGTYDPDTKTWLVETTHHLRNSDYKVVS